MESKQDKMIRLARERQKREAEEKALRGLAVALARQHGERRRVDVRGAVAFYRAEVERRKVDPTHDPVRALLRKMEGKAPTEAKAYAGVPRHGAYGRIRNFRSGASSGTFSMAYREVDDREPALWFGERGYLRMLWKLAEVWPKRTQLPAQWPWRNITGL